MRGFLADVNMQGFVPYLRRLLDEVGLTAILDELGIELVTFPEVGISSNLDDRRLWFRC